MTRHLPHGTMIPPDCCARGLFAWTREWGWAPAEAARRLYDEAAVEVTVSLYGHLPLTVFQGFLQKASLRNLPVELGRPN